MTIPAAGAYITGLFHDHAFVGQATQDALIQSKINDYILWSIHVDGSGNLSYNNEMLAKDGALITSVADPIRTLIEAGRNQGAAETVFLSIGAGGVSDFRNIEDILQAGGAAETNLYANLGLIFGLGADGFDFDYEESITDPVSTIATFGVELYRRLGAKISYCPYYDSGFWIDCLKATRQRADGAQPVTAFNLQCYSGGAGNDPRDWVAALERAGGAATGVRDPQGFVLPGLAVAGSGAGPNYAPAQMTARLGDWGSKGAWLWNSADVMANLQAQGQTLADYGEALLEGVTAPTSGRVSVD